MAPFTRSTTQNQPSTGRRRSISKILCRRRTLESGAQWLTLAIACASFHNLFSVLTTQIDFTHDLNFIDFLPEQTPSSRGLLSPIDNLKLQPFHFPHEHLQRRLFNETDFGGLQLEDTGGRPRWILDVDEKVNRRFDHDEKGNRVDVGWATRNDDPWPSRRPINCNTFHEIGLYTIGMVPHVKNLNKGYFREAIKVDWQYLDQTDTLVWKRVRAKHHELDKYGIETVRIESAVMEELTRSKYIINTQGYCQLVAFVDYMPDGDMLLPAAPYEDRMQTELYDKRRVDPQNNFTVGEKIQKSLEMAYGIAALHGAGYVHDDLKLSQFLIHPDGHIQLNDFNRAMHKYNDTTKTWKSWKNGGRHGDLRSPEEYDSGVLTPAIDIFSMGGIFFSVLTGLIPFDEVYTHDRMTKKFKHGELPEIDARYSEVNPVMKSFVNLIKDCWKFKPTDRPPAQELVQRLEQMKREMDKHPEWDIQLAQKPEDRHSSDKRDSESEDDSEEDSDEEKNDEKKSDAKTKDVNKSVAKNTKEAKVKPADADEKAESESEEDSGGDGDEKKGDNPKENPKQTIQGKDAGEAAKMKGQVNNAVKKAVDMGAADKQKEVKQK